MVLCLCWEKSLSLRDTSWYICNELMPWSDPTQFELLGEKENRGQKRNKTGHELIGVVAEQRVHGGSGYYSLYFCKCLYFPIIKSSKCKEQKRKLSPKARC